jgi:hypothetical protein
MYDDTLNWYSVHLVVVVVVAYKHSHFDMKNFVVDTK